MLAIINDELSGEEDIGGSNYYVDRVLATVSNFTTALQSKFASYVYEHSGTTTSLNDLFPLSGSFFGSLNDKLALLPAVTVESADQY